VTETLTGRGGDIIILDDVSKPDEAFSETVRNTVNELYRSTLTSRLNDKRMGAIICVMRRVHQFDLAGLMIESGLWPHSCVPTTHKVNRANGIRPIVKNKRLFVPFESTWLGEFKSELLDFPNVRYMDQVDALTQMLEWSREEDAQPAPVHNAGPEEMFDNYSEREEDNLDVAEGYDPWSGV